MLQDRPELTSFYKFFTAAVAQRALKTTTLRWSSPILFRDPCELAYQQKLPFTEDELLDEVMRRVAMQVMSKEHPKGIATHSVTQAILRWRKSNRFTSTAEIENSLKNIFVPILEQYQQTLSDIEKDWKKFYRRTRVLAGVESYLDPALWRIYGAQHRGVALEFDCSKESSAVFQSRKPILYQEDRLEITHLMEQVNNIIGQHEIRAQDHFLDILAIKPPTFQTEKEWRFFHVLTENAIAEDAKPETWTTDIAFQAKDLKNIILGIKTTKKERLALTALVKAHFPHVSISKARFESGTFALTTDMVYEGKPQE